LCPREQEPHERRTRQVLKRHDSFLKGPGRRRDERAEAKLEELWRGPDPKREVAGHLFRDKVRRGRPRGRRNDVGGAPQADKALLAGH